MEWRQMWRKYFEYRFFPSMINDEKRLKIGKFVEIITWLCCCSICYRFFPSGNNLCSEFAVDVVAYKSITESPQYWLSLSDDNWLICIVCHNGENRKWNLEKRCYLMIWINRLWSFDIIDIDRQINWQYFTHDQKDKERNGILEKMNLPHKHNVHIEQKCAHSQTRTHIHPRGFHCFHNDR